MFPGSWRCYRDRATLRMDLSPLRGTADFRWLFSSRAVTLLGTEASAVALLVQAKQLTGSAFAVGLLGVADDGQAPRGPAPEAPAR